MTDSQHLPPPGIDSLEGRPLSVIRRDESIKARNEEMLGEGGGATCGQRLAWSRGHLDFKGLEQRADDKLHAQ